MDRLLLLSGEKIPFPQAQIVITQPTLRDISLIGEKNFFYGLEMLNFSKEKLNMEDKGNLENKSDFDILLLIIKEKNAEVKSSVDATMLILALLFPDYNLKVGSKGILLLDNNNNEHLIDNSNYTELLSIINKMFELKSSKDSEASYNPGNSAAKKIADKLKKGREKVSESKGENSEDISILNRYASIISIGLPADINSILNYTVYQLYDVYERYRLKLDFDIHLKAQLAGAKDLKDVDNWMDDIHTSKTQ